MTESLLERNLRALEVGGGDPCLAARLGREEPSREVVFLQTAGGLAVPARAGPRPRPYHSTVDPLNEGRRLAAEYGNGGYLVALGLGGGFHLAALLALPTVARLLVVEASAGLARAVLERIDLRSLLGDRRTRLLLSPEPERLAEILLAEYHPAVHENLGTVPLRSSVEEHREYYRRIVETVRQAAGRIAGDYGVQARFGRKWYLNTLANLPVAERCGLTLPPVQRAAVAGAGPSLERQAERLEGMRPRPFLIAADTALPALLGWGLIPDLVVSIDCQLASYHHFLQGLPRQVPLALDLGSPPILARLAERPMFFASAHPLARYLRALWRPFPDFDTSGGNVAQAAVSVALRLGAREVLLLGLDFSYPERKPYSRGTYLYALLRSIEHRLAPLESRVLSFLLEGPDLLREPGPGTPCWTTHRLREYRQRLQELARNAPTRFLLLEGSRSALPLPDRPAAETEPRSAGFRFTAAASTDWRSFLSSYADGLKRLKPPTRPAGRFLLELDAESRMLWATLLPAAAALRERLPPSERKAHRALELARQWSEASARRLLDR